MTALPKKPAGLTDAQRAARRHGLGGSDVAAVLGLDPWRSPLDVYVDKVEGSQRTENAPMQWGNRLEAPIADAYAERTNTLLATVGTCSVVAKLRAARGSTSRDGDALDVFIHHSRTHYVQKEKR